MKDFEGKIALVTGASRGIGAAVASGLAAKGAHVIALARTQGALEELDDDIRTTGGKCTLIPMDLMRSGDIEKLGPSIHKRFGALDILIGNAGMLGPLSPANHVSAKDWEKVFKVNLYANMALLRTLDPLLRAAPAGRAVFTTSGMATMNTAYYGPYAASKAALNAAVQTYAAETLQTRMKVNLVSPGMVDTQMLGDAFPGGIPAGVKRPEAVVPTYLELCAQECEKHGEIVAVPE